VRPRPVAIVLIFVASIFMAGSLVKAQPSASSAEVHPIPDIPTLMHEVETHQKELDKVREDYTYRESVQSDELDGSGKVKKTETEENEVFYVNTHRIQRRVKKNGKPLTDEEEKKEQESVTKQIEKAQKTPPHTSMHGDSEVSVSRLLTIMKVSNPRRVALNGRETIAFDFTGDPHAKTHGMAEDFSKKIGGTLWVDEKDREVSRMEVHVDDNFHVGGGLVASIQKGSSFVFEQALINQELWLPTAAEVHIGARVLLLKGYHENLHIRNGEYKKFHAEAEQQIGATAKP
jgi:hypothetical protein